MWVKDDSKTRERLKLISRNEKIKNAVIIGITISIFFTFCYGWAGYFTKGGFFKSLDQIALDFPMPILFGAVVGLVYYLSNINRVENLKLVCSRCGKVKDDDGMIPCECGGHFQDIKTMKWVETENKIQSGP